MTKSPAVKKGIVDLKIRYTGQLTDSFNRIMEGLGKYDRVLLEEISKKLGKTKFHEELSTPDKREWYAGLEFAVGDARMVIVFPWSDAKQKKEHPISVYIDRPIPPQLIGQTLEKVARTYEKLNPKYVPSR